MIENAQDDDVGSYECIARNAAGEVKTNTVELRMQHSYNGKACYLSAFEIIGSNIAILLYIAIHIYCNFLLSQVMASI